MKWLMAIPVWSTPRDSLNRFNLVFSRCPYEESPFRVSLIFLVHSFHSFTPRVIKMLDGNESHLRQDFAAQNACTAQMRRFWYP